MNKENNIERDACGGDDFHRRQLKDYVKRLQNENLALTKQLKQVKKCASCTCIEERYKQAIALDDLLHNGMRSALSASTTTLPPVDPEQPHPQMTCREIHTLRSANDSLQNCVDNLQRMLKEKALETIRMEQQHAEAIREREQQINTLHKLLQERSSVNSLEKSEAEMHNDPRKISFLKEREQLLGKVQQLEEQLLNCQLSKSARSDPVGNREVSEKFATLENASTANRYCEPCREIANEWNRIRNINEANRDAFAARIVASTASVSPQPNITDLSKEVDLLKSELKKQADSMERELQRHRANEKLLCEQRDMAYAEVEKISRRCEVLEMELSKRCGEQILKQREQPCNIDAMGKSRRNDDEIEALRSELRKANEKIKLLEMDLNTAKQSNATEDGSARAQMASLRSSVLQLEQNKRNCERRLADQEKTLQQLESDIATLMEEKADLRRRCAELKRLSDEAVAENTKQLNALRKLRSDLANAQEKENESARAHLAEIEAYQTLLKQKEAERALFIEQLRADDHPPHVEDSLPVSEHQVSLERRRFFEEKEKAERLATENQKLSDEVAALKNELKSVGSELHERKLELEREIATKNMLSKELSEAQKMISKKDIELMDANNQIKVIEINVLRLETELMNANEHLKLERESTATLQRTVEEFEELLGEKTAELIALSDDTHRANHDVQRHKETVFDLETKLALQGRELKDTRKKLLQLKVKIKRLEREAAELSPRSASSATPNNSTPHTISPTASPPL
uniref:REST corepressor n=1 Tax=Parascaris univalens TaxID=6257 RepID=A0A915B7Y3_PARUN